MLADLPADTTVRRLTSAGTFMLDRVQYMIGGQHGFQHVLVVTDAVILIEHTRPAPGVTYVGNGRPRGTRPKNSRPSPKP